MKQRMLLVMAAFFGIVAFFLMYQQIDAERKKAMAAARDVSLIRLVREMREGETIMTSDIEEMRTKRFGRTDEIEWGDKDKILGKDLVTSVRKDTLISWYNISAGGKGAGGLSGIIPTTPTYMRAISIAVDSTSSVTNMIRPGDNVDIIGTFKFPSRKGDKELETLTLTILQNVMVLATGNHLAKSKGTPAARGPGDSQKNYSTLTLSLTPKEVEMIIFASQKGRLDFSLRNIQDTSYETKTQSVDFKYLEGHIEDYTAQRKGKWQDKR